MTSLGSDLSRPDPAAAELHRLREEIERLRAQGRLTWSMDRSVNPPCWRLKQIGQLVATVWLNGTWHTWDEFGIGGENSKAGSVEDAKTMALGAAIEQGFVRGIVAEFDPASLPG